MNDLEESLAAAPGRAEFSPQAAAAQRLLPLLAHQAALYTAGSTSLPVETAKELLASLWYTIGLAGPAARAAADPEAVYAAGLRVLQARTDSARRRLRAAERLCADSGSETLTDTLCGLEGFFARYDSRFLAHQVPAVLTYPLCIPVPESLPGVDYVLEYLRRLLWEETLLRSFPARDAAWLWDRACPGWRELPLNRCEPAAVQAVGCALAGGAGLRMSRAQRRALSGRLAALSPAGMQALVRGAALPVWRRAGIRAPEPQRYLSDAASALVPRADAVLAAGGELGGLLFCREAD